MRKLKLHFFHLSDFNISCFHEYRVTIKLKKDGSKVKGLLCKCSKSIPDDVKTAIKNKYSNVLFYKVKKEYAPELVCDGIVLLDKCL